MLAGAGVGLGLSLAVTGGGVHPGAATAVNSGSIWGASGALWLAGALDPEAREVASLMILGQLLGTASGALIAVSLKPHSGTVSRVNSAGLWTAFGTLMVMVAGSQKDGY